MISVVGSILRTVIYERIGVVDSDAEHSGLMRGQVSAGSLETCTRTNRGYLSSLHSQW